VASDEQEKRSRAEKRLGICGTARPRSPGDRTPIAGAPREPAGFPAPASRPQATMSDMLDQVAAEAAAGIRRDLAPGLGPEKVLIYFRRRFQHRDTEAQRKNYKRLETDGILIRSSHSFSVPLCLVLLQLLRAETNPIEATRIKARIISNLGRNGYERSHYE